MATVDYEDRTIIDGAPGALTGGPSSIEDVSALIVWLINAREILADMRDLAGNRGFDEPTVEFYVPSGHAYVMASKTVGTPPKVKKWAGPDDEVIYTVSPDCPLNVEAWDRALGDSVTYDDGHVNEYGVGKPRS